MIASPLKRWLAFVLVFAAAPLLFLLSRRRRAACRHPEAPRVLVIPQLTRIGDLVCATPVFRAIKERYPESFVAVVVTKMVAGVLSGNLYLDEVIVYRSDGLWQLLKTIRARRFCWSFCLSGSVFGTLVALAGLVPRRVTLTYQGRTLLERAVDWVNTERVFFRHHTFLPRQYVRMLGALGIGAASLKADVFIVPEAGRAAEEFFRRAGLAESNLLIGMAIAAGNKIKEWGDEKFAGLARALIERYDATVLLIGSGREAGRLEALRASLAPGRSLVAAGLPLEVLPALLRRCRLFIAADTGPVYVAHALGVPLIDIIGPVDPAEQPPEDALSIQVKPPSSIKPSSFVFKRPGLPEEHKRATDSISVEAVFAAAARLLDTEP